MGRLPRWLSGKEPACTQEPWVRSLGREGPLEGKMAARSSILAWKIPWTEEPPSTVQGTVKSQARLSTCTHTCACTHTHTHTRWLTQYKSKTEETEDALLQATGDLRLF